MASKESSKRDLVNPEIVLNLAPFKILEYEKTHCFNLPLHEHECNGSDRAYRSGSVAERRTQ